MNDALAAVVAKAQREKTPFCERYIEFLQAGLPKAVQDSVVFNIVDWQWKEGKLRTDRQWEPYEGFKMVGTKPQGWDPGRFKANEDAILSNKSDEKILAEMVAFKEENSLDMCETGEAWFEYVTEGGELPGR